LRDNYLIYDTHTHLGRARHSGRQFHLDEMINRMDRSGIDRSLLIPFPVVEDYREAHDEIARAVEAHPDRFAGAACLYPFVPAEEFRAELRRCKEQLGFRALKLQPQYQALNPVSPSSDFLFAAALEVGMPVVCHTGTGAPFALPSLFIMVARRFPALPIVLAHSGGSVYYLESIVAASVCPNIYLELSSLMPHHIHEVLQHVTVSRLLIGSDVPESVDTEISKILGLGIERPAKEDILWNNPRRLFDGVSA
jgi:predicted TIM-barrel fold metal-dependent hydrolase